MTDFLDRTCRGDRRRGLWPNDFDDVLIMALPAARLALDEFLAWENTQATRHGFFRGEVFSRVGARRSHGTVVGNLMRTC